jgi:hypothetical protein
MSPSLSRVETVRKSKKQNAEAEAGLVTWDESGYANVTRDVTRRD